MMFFFNVIIVENSSHGSHDLSQSTTDFNDTVACHLSYTHLQSADERNEMNSMRWQNSYTEEYQHMGWMDEDSRSTILLANDLVIVFVLSEFVIF